MNLEIEISHETKAPGSQLQEPVRAVFKGLLELFLLYTASGCYNYVPYTKDGDNAWEYFGRRLQQIRKQVTLSFLGKSNTDVERRLERVIRETEIFIRSFSVPGVVKRWRKINPRINYFDCVFHLTEEQMEKERLWRNVLEAKGLLGKRTPSGFPMFIWYAYIPTKEEVEAKNRYFQQIEKENEDGNLRYDDHQIFQNELVRTLRLVFEHDFADIL